ncbi:MAG TPA: SDR family NAD(P)-dependent oxidoreductase [Myxococcota bacterium]|nr:SDR family NAD(P)-dependent oxidoreductase [Myxococcota bacterium]
MAGIRGGVVVSGSSTGIGRATALRLARAGHRVFAGVRRLADADSLRAEGLPALEPLLFDVTDAAAVRAAAKAVAAEVGDAGLLGVVANAGVGVGGPLEFLALDEMRRQLEVNVLGVLSVVQAFLPLVRRARGRVVITGSIGGRNAMPIVGPYATSKFALEGMAEALRRELAPLGVHVALIEPGSIATPMMLEKTPQTGAELLAKLEGEAKQLYGPMARAMLEAFAGFGKRAIPPERVALAIEHALTAGRPKARYLVGTDAKLQALLVRLLPDRWRDALITRLVGLPR